MTEQIEALIRELVAERGPGKTICPSEVARSLAGKAGFREIMPLVRDCAAALSARDEIVVTQKGQTVDPLTARGPIRLGAPRGSTPWERLPR